ncbi:MAG: hypothetical protein ACXV5L_12860 [Thermoanaerobaculia bacterium]
MPGTVVYPPTGTPTDCVDAYQCRFLGTGTDEVDDGQIATLLLALSAEHRWGHIEKLHEFDGQPAFTMAQGES